MARHPVTLTGLIFVVMACLGTAAFGQSVFYTFESGPGGDGFNWPPSPTGTLNGSDYTTPDGVLFYNETGNNVFYDDFYQTLGNGTHISGDALWGNPLDNGASGYVGIDLFNFNQGDITEVSFDFAWTEAGVPAAPDFVNIYLEDSDGRGVFDSFQLNDTFTGLGGSTGFEDSLSFQASNFTDDFGGIGGTFIDIAYMEIYVEDIYFGGNNSEFAIDNFATNGGGGGLDPANSNVFPGDLGACCVLGQASKWLRSTTSHNVGLAGVDISNDGTGGTTFSVELDPASDPEWVSAFPATNVVINGNQQIDFGGGTVALIDRNNLSGTYVGNAIVKNDLNPLDPDESVSITIEIYDPPDLTDDSGSTVQVDVDPTIFVSNAAVLGHAGALRAGAEISNLQTSGPFKFSTQTGDLISGAFIGPNETKTATIEFNRFGLINGTYNGTASVDWLMNSAAGSFLNGDPTVPMVINWTLDFDHTTISSDSLALNASDSFGPDKIGVNDDDTAVTLIDGTSSSTQTIDMDFVFNPDPFSSAFLVGDPVDISSSVGSDLYVVEFTFDAVDLPPSIPPLDLIVVEFDTTSTEYNPAVEGNGDGGAGSTIFVGTYEDFIASRGGGAPLNAGDLSTFGIDTVNDHVWAILDHEGIFGLGILTPVLAGDLDGDGFVGINDLNIVLANWNQNVPPANPQADPSGDGFVGIDDLNAVLGNWNAGTPPGESAQIPEPGTLMLIGCCSLAWLRRRDTSDR